MHRSSQISDRRCTIDKCQPCLVIALWRMAQEQKRAHPVNEYRILNPIQDDHDGSLARTLKPDTHFSRQRKQIHPAPTHDYCAQHLYPSEHSDWHHQGNEQSGCRSPSVHPSGNNQSSLPKRVHVRRSDIRGRFCRKRMRSSSRHCRPIRLHVVHGEGNRTGSLA